MGMGKTKVLTPILIKRLLYKIHLFRFIFLVLPTHLVNVSYEYILYNYSNSYVNTKFVLLKDIDRNKDHHELIDSCIKMIKNGLKIIFVISDSDLKGLKLTLLKYEQTDSVKKFVEEMIKTCHKLDDQARKKVEAVMKRVHEKIEELTNE